MTRQQLKKISLVTGANRGLGLETCRRLAEMDHTVILTSRDMTKGKAAAQNLSKKGLQIYYHPLDVTDIQSIQTIRTYVEDGFGRLDILINNAGIFLDTTDVTDLETVQKLTSPFQAKREVLIQTFKTNTLGPFFMCQTFIPLMIKNRYGRVVNVTSQLGQLSTMGSGWTSYRISKTALNAVTRIFAKETEGMNILVNSVHPGWVQTDMGGPSAPKSVAEGVETILWASTLPKGGPTGLFFKDKEPISW